MGSILVRFIILLNLILALPAWAEFGSEMIIDTVVSTEFAPVDASVFVSYGDKDPKRYEATLLPPQGNMSLADQAGDWSVGAFVEAPAAGVGSSNGVNSRLSRMPRSRDSRRSGTDLSRGRSMWGRPRVRRWT